MKSVSIAVLIAFAGALALSAQAVPNTPFPDQFVAVTVDYNAPNTTTPISGSVAYGKLTNASLGVYSFTQITETSITTKPVSIQTLTQTGIGAFLFKLGAFDVFGTAVGGLATAGSSTGPAAGGKIHAFKSLGKGWFIGFSGGPQYSGPAGLGANFGIDFGYGK